MNYDFIWSKALNYAKKKYLNHSKHKWNAFANSVSYLMTGVSLGKEGPNMREYAVIWILSKSQIEDSFEIYSPDYSFKSPGDWSFEESCKFVETICFGDLPEICAEIYEKEVCFDDDFDDIEKVKEILAQSLL